MAGYSCTPLVKKLGIKANNVLHLVDVPEEYFDWISPLPADVTTSSKPKQRSVDFAHLFAKTKKQFESGFAKIKPLLSKTGMPWVSCPKQVSKVPTDLDESIIPEFSMASRLVAVNVCAVCKVWLGLKFVYREKDR